MDHIDLTWRIVNAIHGWDSGDARSDQSHLEDSSCDPASHSPPTSKRAARACRQESARARRRRQRQAPVAAQQEFSRTKSRRTGESLKHARCSPRHKQHRRSSWHLSAAQGNEQASLRGARTMGGGYGRRNLLVASSVLRAIYRIVITVTVRGERLPLDVARRSTPSTLASTGDREDAIYV